jgi:hypothetical protein
MTKMKQYEPIINHLKKFMDLEVESNKRIWTYIESIKKFMTKKNPLLKLHLTETPM